MALIGTIRKNGWILIVMMTLALGGFILMEIISNAQRNSAGDANTLGKVNGEEIRRADFEKYQALIYSNADGNSSYQVRGQAWEFFVERTLITQLSEKLGLGVCRDELRDLEFGTNISPLIKERYKSPDGALNMNYLNSVKNAIDAGQLVDQQQFPFRSAWIEQEHEVVKDRLIEKVTQLLVKGMYTPAWQAELAYRENNERLDFRYVRIGYEKVKDDEAPLTDADYSAYLKENPHLYDAQEESRVISYAVFNVLPTGVDTAAARDAILKIKNEWTPSKNDSSYVTTNNGIFDQTYKIKSALPAAIADTLMRLAPGSLFGPYLDGGAWNIGKLLDRKSLPDSVRARHILLKGNNPAFANTLDSLKGLITSGKARFDSLAIKVSQDGSGPKGGDLGWFGNGQMVPEFNTVCFYTGEQGKLYILKTQFGYHLLEITGKKFIKNEAGVRAVFLKQRIEPGKATQQMAKDKAIALVQGAKNLTDLTNQATQQKIELQSSKSLKTNDYALEGLGTGSDAREIIRWVFGENVKAGTLSKDVFSFRDESGGYFDSKYVVAAVKSIAPKGSASVATLKALPDAETKVRQVKKGEIIKAKIGTNTDLSAIAAEYQAKVDTVKAVSMMSSGGEPRVLGTVFHLAKGETSGPILGSSGVYVIQTLSDKPQTQIPADLTMFRKQYTSSAATTIRTNLLPSLKKYANIKDNRSRFY